MEMPAGKRKPKREPTHEGDIPPQQGVNHVHEDKSSLDRRLPSKTDRSVGQLPLHLSPYPFDGGT